MIKSGLGSLPAAREYHSGGQVKNKHWRPGSKEPKYVSDHGHAANGEILIQGDDRIVPDAQHDRYGNPHTSYNKLRHGNAQAAVRPPEIPMNTNWQGGSLAGSRRAPQAREEQFEAPRNKLLKHPWEQGAQGWGNIRFMPYTEQDRARDEQFRAAGQMGKQGREQFGNAMDTMNGANQQDPFMNQGSWRAPMHSQSHSPFGQNPFAPPGGPMDLMANNPWAHPGYQTSQVPQSQYQNPQVPQMSSMQHISNMYGGPVEHGGFQNPFGQQQSSMQNPFGGQSFGGMQNPFAMAFGQQMSQPQQNRPANPMATQNFQNVFANQQPPSNHMAHSNQVTGRPQEPWMRQQPTGGSMGQQAGGGVPLPTPGKSVF